MLKIDNISLDILSGKRAKLLSRKIKPCNFTNKSFWNEGSLMPFISKTFLQGFKSIDLELDLICKNADELELLKSNLINKIKQCKLQFDDIKLNYQVYLEAEPDISYIMQGNEILKLKLLGYCFKDEAEESLNRINKKTINVIGTLASPVIVEINPSVDLIDLTIKGLSEYPILIKNLHANKKIIIDGEKGTVLEDGINKFVDTDFWEFPFLSPGTNTITLSKNSCNVIIKYKPRYI